MTAAERGARPNDPHAAATPHGALWRDAGAGTGLGLITATQSLVHGLVAFGALGPKAAAFGTASALAASSAVGLAVAALASTRPLAAGTSAITALVTASFLASAGPATLGEATALAMLLAGLAGLLVLAASWAGLGRLAGLVPAPVTIGLINSGVVLILLGQAPLALGLQPGQGLGAGPLHLGSLIVALASAVTMGLRFGAVPASVVALAAGTAAHHALAAHGVPLGLAVSYAPTPLLLSEGIAEAWHAMPGLLAQEGLAARLAPSVLSLAVLVMLEAVVAITAMRDLSGRRSDQRRDLFSVGAGCAAAALVGGFPGTLLNSGSIAYWRQGGRGRLGVVIRSALCLAALTAAGRAIALLPFAALAGTLIGHSLPMFRWQPLLPRRGPGFARRAADALMIAIIIVGGVAFGLAVSILIGVLLSIIVFTGSMAQSVIRRSIRGPVGRSRVRRPAEDVAMLADAADRIALDEVEGALFFGTADRLLDHLARLRQSAVEIIVLDLERVTRIDATGAHRLGEACRSGGRVLVAPLYPASRVATELAAIGLADAVPPASA